ncbi:hypothetical protein Q8F89_28855, partial [Klebsiella pneumoniae]|nr:hypothetical protein [Klebsiella pneumoniae]
HVLGAVYKRHAGLVAIGAAVSGEVRAGNTLWRTGGNTPMRVRGLHDQHQAVGRAHAGQRTALHTVGGARNVPLIHSCRCRRSL